MTTLKICLVTIIFTAIYIIISVFLSNLLFYHHSNGSLIKISNKTIGSKLIGQEFKSLKYFHNRPSQINYNNNLSGNSNLPFYSEKLKEDVLKNYSTFKQINNNGTTDLNFICESASGLDPHITYLGAISQIQRISNLSGINKDMIKKIIDKNAKPRILGILGEKIVNVLELNIELKKIYVKAS